MRPERTCPDCGATLPADAPRGLCPNCLMGAALPSTSPSAHEATGAFEPATGTFEPASPGVLDTIAQTIGPVPRVLLRDTAPGETPGPVVRPDATDSDPSIRYRIDGEIARGGMGSVLKGRDPDLGRDVAIKVLRPDLRDNADLVRRFVEEAQIGGQLQHPGVVPIYELGTFADRRPFFSMKLVKGRTLADLLAARSAPADDLPRLLSIYAAIAQTMAYSHTRGVIHRDLKPSNVMVGSFGEVQVMDWGLARVLPRGGAAADARAGKEPPQETVITTAGSGSDRDLSRAGSIMGTPSYMPPEQARGQTDRIDERADVFALGSILCEVLTGSPAFTGRAATEILRKAADGATADALIRLDGCGAEAELIGLAKHCLAVEPEDRPHDARAVAERITAYLAGVQERVQAAERERAVAVARAIEERRRRKVQLALAASVLALTTLGGLSTTYYLQQRAEQARREIELAAATDRVVGRAETLRDQARETREDLSRWQVALAAVEQAEAAQHEGAANRLLAVRTEVQAGLEGARRDKALLDRVVDIRSAEFDDPDGSITDRDYADAFREAGIDPATLPPAEAGARIKARPPVVAIELAGALDDWAAIRRDKRGNASAASRLNEVASIADPDPWRVRLRAALDQPDKAARRIALQSLAKQANYHELGPISLYRLATGLFGAGDSSEARAVLRKAQQRYPQDVWINYDLANLSSGDEAIRFYMVARAIRPETAHALAHRLDQRGDSDEALGVFRNLRDLRPGNEANLGCLGDLLKRKGLIQEAGKAYEAAAAAGRDAIRLKPDSPETHSSLARALMRQDKLDEAIAELRTVQRLEPHYYFNWPGSVQVDLLRVQAGLSEAEYRLDLAITYVQHSRAHELENSNPRQAEPLFRQALESYRKIQGPDGPMTFELANDLSKVLELTGRSAEADSLFRDALARAGNQFGPGHPQVLGVIHKRAHALEFSEPGEAEPLFRQALEGYRKMEGSDGHLTLDLTNDLANLLDRTGRSALAEPLFRDALERARKQFRPADPRTAGIMASFGLSLIRRGKWDAAEPLLRECLAIREKSQPEEWSTFNTRSLLGGSLLGQKRYDQAEPLILSGYEGMKAREARIPPGGKPRLTEAAERVARLPEARRLEWQALWADVQALLKREQGRPAKTVATASKMPAKAPEPAPDLTSAAVKTLLADLRQAGNGRLADALTQEIHKAQDFRKWNRNGHVIVGRVICAEGDDPSRVLAQMPIHSEGYFVGPVKESGRPVGFRRQGYLPAQITPSAEPGSVEYVGEVRLTRMPETMRSAVRGRIVLEEDVTATTVTASLSLVAPFNHPSHGDAQGHLYSGNANVSRSVEFSASGLSPTDYSVYISAPGYLGQERTIRLNPGETHDEETITLERARNVAISYRVATRPPFTEASPERQTVLGGDRFRANWQDSPEYYADLVFPQNNGKISFRAVYGPCSIADLGPGKVEDFLVVDPTSAKFTDPRNVVPQSGHVYLLDHQHSGNHWVLFQPEFDEKVSQVPGRP